MSQQQQQADPVQMALVQFVQQVENARKDLRALPNDAGQIKNFIANYLLEMQEATLHLVAQIATGVTVATERALNLAQLAYLRADQSVASGAASNISELVGTLREKLAALGLGENAEINELLDDIDDELDTLLGDEDDAEELGIEGDDGLDGDEEGPDPITGAGDNTIENFVNQEPKS